MYQHGKFRSAGGSRPGAVKSAGEKPPQTTEKKPGEEQSPHGGGPVEHVTKTHPGQTQPHPATGVHAFHGHHVGGGKYKSFTHHNGGEVEEKDHAHAGDMHHAMQEALPDDGEQTINGGQDPDYMSALSGIGGESTHD